MRATRLESVHISTRVRSKVGVRVDMKSKSTPTAMALKGLFANRILRLRHVSSHSANKRRGLRPRCSLLYLTIARFLAQPHPSERCGTPKFLGTQSIITRSTSSIPANVTSASTFKTTRFKVRHEMLRENIPPTHTFRVCLHEEVPSVTMKHVPWNRVGV